MNLTICRAYCSSSSAWRSLREKLREARKRPKRLNPCCAFFWIRLTSSERRSTTTNKFVMSVPHMGHGISPPSPETSTREISKPHFGQFRQMDSSCPYFLRIPSAMFLSAGLDRRLGARIVNYADDLVICCKGDGAHKALAAMRRMMNRLKLTVNEEKTRICRIPDEEFVFPGKNFGGAFSPQAGGGSPPPPPTGKEYKAHNRGWAYKK